MVPAHSHKVSRVSWYSGYRHVNSSFAYGAFTLSGWLSQNHSAKLVRSIMRSEPRSARTPVWALSRSLAATYGIDFSFSSCRYLDVSVPCVLPRHDGRHAVSASKAEGFPHSDIGGSSRAYRSSPHFAVRCVLHRLSVPRHSPYALSSLTL